MIARARAIQTSVASTRDLWSKHMWRLLVACGFLIFVSASSIYLVISSQSRQETMNRALHLENKFRGIIAGVRSAESEQRGYLLTGDSAYLENFQSTIDASATALADVKAAIGGDQIQQRAFAEIEPLMTRIVDGEIDPSFIITHRIGLEEGPEAYKTFRDKKDGCVKVVIRPNG